MNKVKKFIKYNNLFIIILGLILMLVLPLKIDIPWVSAAVRTGLGKAIVLVVPDNMSVDEFLASVGLSENGNFSKPKISGRIISQGQGNVASENIVLWLKDKDEDGILDTQDFSRYSQEIKTEKEFLEITNDPMLFPTSYIGVEIWLKGVPSGILLKAGASYSIENNGSSLYFKLNNESIGSLSIPSDGKTHQVILSFDGISAYLAMDGKEKQQFTPSFATLSRSAENLLVNPHLESLRIFSQPMGEDRFRDAYNELASSFGMEILELEPVCQLTTEICDGLDNDCDSLVDEDLIQQCGSSDIGACQFGVQTCQDGVWSECQEAIEPTEEICDGFIDENCDGVIDENCDGNISESPGKGGTGTGETEGEECDSTHLNLCVNQPDCETVKGFWYKDACNSEPETSACILDWQCIDWTPLPEANACGETFTQTRTCVDANECGNEEGKPIESQEEIGTDNTSCGATSCDASLNLTGECQNTCTKGTCQSCVPTCSCATGYQKDESGACQLIPPAAEE